jgi:hypothetical protein
MRGSKKRSRRRMSKMRIVVVSDDWSGGDFVVFNSIVVAGNPDEAYSKYIQSTRESWGEDIICDFEVDINVDLWVAEVAEKLGLGKVIKVHLFCIKKTTEDEEGFNIIVFLLSEVEE